MRHKIVVKSYCTLINILCILALFDTFDVGTFLRGQAVHIINLHCMIVQLCACLDWTFLYTRYKWILVLLRTDLSSFKPIQFIAVIGRPGGVPPGRAITALNRMGRHFGYSSSSHGLLDVVILSYFKFKSFQCVFFLNFTLTNRKLLDYSSCHFLTIWYSTR